MAHNLSASAARTRGPEPQELGAREPATSDDNPRWILKGRDVDERILAQQEEISAKVRSNPSKARSGIHMMAKAPAADAVEFAAMP
jgi:hypothetical protein